MRRLRAVVLKEVRQVRRDPFSLMMLIALPAFMLVLYGFALNFDVRHVRLAVQDRDRSAASRELVASFTHSSYFDLVATPAVGENLDALLERRTAWAVLVIPEGYARDLAAGRASPVQFLLDGADSTTAQTVLGYARALVSEQNAGLLLDTGAIQPLSDPLATCDLELELVRHRAGTVDPAFGEGGRFVARQTRRVTARSVP